MPQEPFSRPQPQYWIKFLDPWAHDTGLGSGNLIGRAQFPPAPALDKNRSPIYPLNLRGGWQIHHPNLGGGVSEAPCFAVFFEGHLQNLGGERSPPKFRGYGHALIGTTQKLLRVVADVWEKDVWNFQAKSGSPGSCPSSPTQRTRPY